MGFQLHFRIEAYAKFATKKLLSLIQYNFNVKKIFWSYLKKYYDFRNHNQSRGGYMMGYFGMLNWGWRLFYFGDDQKISGERVFWWIRIQTNPLLMSIRQPSRLGNIDHSRRFFKTRSTYPLIIQKALKFIYIQPISFPLNYHLADGGISQKSHYGIVYPSI